MFVPPEPQPERSSRAPPPRRRPPVARSADNASRRASGTAPDPIDPTPKRAQTMASINKFDDFPHPAPSDRSVGSASQMGRVATVRTRSQRSGLCAGATANERTAACKRSHGDCDGVDHGVSADGARVQVRESSWAALSVGLRARPGAVYPWRSPVVWSE